MVRKPVEVRRRDLVEAGLRVIAREGMHGATVRAIVAEAGVPLATFHYVFDSRDQMIGEAYAFIVLPEVTSGAMPLPPSADLLTAVQDMLQDWVDRFEAQPQYELAVMEIMAYCKRTPSLQHLPAAVQARYVEAVSDLIDAVCGRAGHTPAMPIGQLAEIVLHVTDGLTYHLLRTEDADAARRYVAAAAPMLVSALRGVA